MRILQIKGFFLIPILMYTFACKTSVYRLESPKTKEEIKSVGLVGYGIYLEYPPGLIGNDKIYYSGQAFGDHTVVLDANSKVNAKKEFLTLGMF